MKNEDNMEIFEQMMLMISKDFIFDVIKSEFIDNFVFTIKITFRE